MNRCAGVLMSITSLPSKHGIGCFSHDAYEFVDWLAAAGQKYWQILPMGKTSYGPSGDSPYQSFSAFAGNPYLIDLDQLVEEGFLTQEEVDAADLEGEDGRVDFEKLHHNRYPLLRKAYQNSRIHENPAFHDFIRDNAWWLDDYALFMAVKARFDYTPFQEWPEDIRKHWGYSIDYYNRELYFEVEYRKFLQFEFFTQWNKLKKYANDHGIQIVGDIPIYVSMDSADVWAHPELFQLDEENVPAAISGCPPDAFAAEGQVWGNPLYRWDYHRNTDYEWWASRVWHNFRLCDVLRIDHFRGFDEYFAISAETRNALEGHWEKGPGMHFFNRLKEKLGEKEIIAEDLGLLTESVRQLVRDSGYPNMKVLQFGFDPNDLSGTNDYLPHNFGPNSAAYTGTHDNDTLQGWLTSMSKEEVENLRAYLGGCRTALKKMNWPLIEMVFRTNSRIAIVPIQDYLELGGEARMNRPGTVVGNWTWRMPAGSCTAELAEKVNLITLRYGRMNWDAKR